MSESHNPIAESIDFVTNAVHESHNSTDSLCEFVGVLRSDLRSEIGNVQCLTHHFSDLYQSQQNQIQHLTSLVKALHANQQAEIQSLKTTISVQSDQIHELQNRVEKQDFELQSLKEKSLCESASLPITDPQSDDFHLLERSYDSQIHKIHLLESSFKAKFQTPQVPTEAVEPVHTYDFSQTLPSLEDDVFYDDSTSEVLTEVSEISVSDSETYASVSSDLSVNSNNDSEDSCNSSLHHLNMQGSPQILREH